MRSLKLNLMALAVAAVSGMIVVKVMTGEPVSREAAAELAGSIMTLIAASAWLLRQGQRRR